MWNFSRFRKAFDTVDHDILIEKLDFCEIRGIAKDWFASYLSDRNNLLLLMV